MPRYPGSVRTKYEREDLGGIIATDVEYATTDAQEDVQEFYRDAFEAEGWEEADVGFDRGEIFYVVVKGEVQVEVEEHGEFTEVEIEDEEPSP